MWSGRRPVSSDGSPRRLAPGGIRFRRRVEREVLGAAIFEAGLQETARPADWTRLVPCVWCEAGERASRHVFRIFDAQLVRICRPAAALFTAEI